MATYLLETAACWAVFYGIYHLLLRGETFHRTNRWYLIGTLLLGLGIPALDIELLAPAKEAYLLQPITVGAQELEAIVVTASKSKQAIDFQIIGMWVYWLGVAVSLARFGFGLLQIRRLFAWGEVLPANGYRFVTTTAPHLPFSFFDNLFWSKKLEVTAEERRSIVRHEEAHIFQRHSHDVVLLELVAAFAWCVPFVYFYKKAVKTTHEYLADAYVTAGFDKKQYGRLLLRQSHPGMQVAISNSIFSSQLKKRIVMMTKTKSPQRATLKYLAVLPALAMLLMAFSFDNSQAQHHSELLDDQLAMSEEEAFGFTIGTDTVPAGQNEEEVFKVVEEMPRFPGCEEVADAAERKKCSETKLIQYLFSNVKFPQDAAEKGFTGTVVVRFIVEKDGSIVEAEVVKGVEGGCGEEVLRVVYTMPKWIPGKQRGRAVRTQFMLPVKFRLDDNPAPAEAKKPLSINDLDEKPVMGCCEGFSGEARENCSNQSLVSHIFDHLKYPAEARTKGIEGTVFVKFVVEEDGSVTKPEIVKSVGSGCDEEVLRVIGLMPKWSPGRKAGKAVASSFTLPIKFKLDAAAQTAELFEVYPNPAASGGFNVKFKAPAGPVSILVYDVAKGGDPVEKQLMKYDGTEQSVHFPTTGLFGNGETKGSLVVTLIGENQTVLASRTVLVW